MGKDLNPIESHTKSLYRNNIVASLLIRERINKDAFKRFHKQMKKQENVQQDFSTSQEKTQGTNGENKERGSK